MGSLHYIGYVSLFAVGAWAVTALALAIGVRFAARRDPRTRFAPGLPRLGGVVIFALLVAELALRSLAPDWIERYGFTPLPLNLALWQLGAYALVFGLGMLEDLRPVGRAVRVAGLVAAAGCFLMSQPAALGHLFAFGISNILTYAAVLGWLVIAGRSMTAIDGLEGLSTGLAAIMALGIFAVNAGSGDTAGPTLTALAVGGACLGFLPFNMYPARALLGTGGGRLLGFALAALAIQSEATGGSGLVSAAIPVLFFGVPLIDLALILISRRKLRTGDRSHLHHRLQQLGLKPRSTVFTLWAAGAYFAVVAWSLSRIADGDAAYVLLSVFPMAAFWVIALRFVERRMALKAAQFGHLFVQRSDAMFVDRGALVGYLRERRGQSFSVVVFDSTDSMLEIARERPIRVVEFHLNLYAILKARLRRSDFVARMSDHRVVAILANNDGRRERDQPLIDYLNVEVRALQESFNVHGSEPGRAEGVRVLRYPNQDSEIWSVLGITPRVFESPDSTEPPRRVA